MLFHQACDIRLSGRDLETRAEGETAVLPRELLEAMDRLDSQTVGALRRFTTHLFTEFIKRSIDLILKKSGTRTRAAMANVATVDEGTIDTPFHQLMSQKSAANTATDNQGIATKGLCQGWVDLDQTIPNGPKR
jgi:hypothetical protein